tara:strand:+ start:1647 stop:2090 length:444 start_codon:yes stop_codon:yes gene_type:complete
MTDFILPCIFSLILSVWYFSFMNNLNALETLPLHLFTTTGRGFYGLLLSLPFETLLQVVISRLTVWVFFLLLAVDLLQLSSTLSDFDHYQLADAVGLLFGGLFVVFDLFFVFASYRLSTKEQLVPRCSITEAKAPVSTTAPLRFKPR